MAFFKHSATGEVLIPEVWLCKRNKDRVALLRCTQPTVVLNLNDFNTIEFDMYRFIDGELNPNYDLVQTKMLVYLGEVYGYFSIQVDMINDDGYEHKHVTGNSWECELSSRYLIDFQVNTFEEGDPVDSHGDFIVTTFWNTDDGKCLLKRVFQDTGWDVRMANTTSASYQALCATERTYDISRQDKLSFLKDLEEELEVLFVFDKTERIATCYLLDEYGIDTGIYSSFLNLNKSIEITCDESKIVTRLTVLGGDNIYVDDVIPSASNAITNIDYFLTTQYMSQNAIDAYNYWKQKYNELSVQYSDKLLAVNEAFDKIMTYQNSAPMSQVSEDDGTITELNEMTRDELLAAFTWVDYPSTVPPEEQYNYGQVYLQSIYDAYNTAKELRVDEEGKRTEDYDGTSLTAGLSYYSNTKTYNQGDKVLYPYASQSYLNYPDKIPAAYEYINSTSGSGHDPTDTTYWNQVVPGKYDQINIILNCAQYNLNILSEKIALQQAEYKRQYNALMKIKEQADMKKQINNWVLLNQTAYLTTYNGEYIISGQSASGSTIYYIGSDFTSATNALTEAIYDEIMAFIWEDEYSNENYIPEDPNDYKECIEVAQELLEQAEKTLNKNCYPRVTWECDLYNPALRDEFLFAKDRLDVGNYMYLEMHEGYTEKIRIIGIEIPFNDLPNVKLIFADRVESDNVFESIGEAIGSSSSVSASLEEYVGQMEAIKKTTEELNTLVKDGLNASLVNVFNNENQEVKIDNFGVWGRKKIESGDYDDRQIRIQNNQIVFTDDNWKTARAALGEITLYDMDGNPHTSYGLIADTIAVSDLYTLRATIGGWHINPDSLTSNGYVDGEHGIKLGSEGTIETPFFYLDEKGQVTLTSNNDSGSRLNISSGRIAFYDYKNGTYVGRISTIYNKEGFSPYGGLGIIVDNDSWLHLDYEDEQGIAHASIEMNTDKNGAVKFSRPVTFNDIIESGIMVKGISGFLDTIWIKDLNSTTEINCGYIAGVQENGVAKNVTMYAYGDGLRFTSPATFTNSSVTFSGWRTSSDSGYSTNVYGNFKHLGTGTSDYWAILSNSDTLSFTVNYESGNIGVAGSANIANGLTVKGISSFSDTMWIKDLNGTTGINCGYIAGVQENGAAKNVTMYAYGDGWNFTSPVKFTGNATIAGNATIGGTLTLNSTLYANSTVYHNGLAGFSRYVYLKDGEHGDTVVGTLSASATASGSTYTPSQLSLSMSGNAPFAVSGNMSVSGSLTANNKNVLEIQAGETINVRTEMGVFPAMVLSSSTRIRMSIMLPRAIPSGRTITVDSFSGLYLRTAAGGSIYYGTTYMNNLSSVPSGITVTATRGGENIVNVTFFGTNGFVTSSGGSTLITNLSAINAIVTSMTLKFN